MKKLIKINEQHYVIVDENLKIEEGKHFLTKENIPHTNFGWNFGDRVIIYSTLPLVHPNCCISKDGGTTKGNSGCAYRNGCLDDVPLIKLEDVEEAIDNTYELFKEIDGSCNENEYEHWLFKQGFKAHKELTKDNLFTISDMIRAMRYSSEITNNKLSNIKNYIESVLPKTEWNVDVINDKIVLL